MGLYRRCAACQAVACGTARQGLLERGILSAWITPDAAVAEELALRNK